MITLCHAVKGGSGTTVVACTRAIDAHQPTLLVDLCGDAPAMLGLAEPERPGALDWLASAAPTAHLDDLLVTVTPQCQLLPARLTDGASPSIWPDVDDERWSELAEWLTEWCDQNSGTVVVDAGTAPVPASFTDSCATRWLVTRACYLSLRRAGRAAVRSTGVVLIEEPGRRLGERDVETATRAPIIATIAWDPRVAGAVDSGLLLTRRLPRGVRRAFARVAA